MIFLSKPAVRLLALSALAAAPLVAAHAHGEFDGVGDLSEHMSEYESEIGEMSATADRIAADYANGEDVASRVDALVSDWEQVEFHEAVETEAMILYPPIWVALGNLEKAVSDSGRDTAAREAASELRGSLHEALGALKYIAARDDGATESADHAHEHEHDDDRPVITIIQDNLDTVVERYNGGEIEAAKELVFQTYMQRFEGIEGDLIERDADLVTDLEKDFNARLPQLLDQSDAGDEVADQVSAMNDKLDRAQGMLDEAAEEQSSVF